MASCQSLFTYISIILLPIWARTYLNYHVRCGKPGVVCAANHMFCAQCTLTESVWHLNRFPFPWKNPYGFFIAVAIQYIMLTGVLMMASCVLTLSTGFFSLVLTMAKVIKQSLRSINRNSKKKKNRTAISNQITRFIRYHSMVKQLSRLAFIYRNTKYLVHLE